MHKLATRTPIAIGLLSNFSPGLAGLLLDDYRPVSGNWCWLSDSNPALRYALGHAWRIVIIFVILCLYAYLSIYMHRHFAAARSVEDLSPDSVATSSIHNRNPSTGDNAENQIYIYNEFEIYEDTYWHEDPPKEENTDYLRTWQVEDRSTKINISHKEEDITPPPSPIMAIKQIFQPSHTELNIRSTATPSPDVEESLPFTTRDPLAMIRRPPPTNITTSISTSAPRVTVRAQEFRIQKLLLLNAYPFGYIILWIPGILYRFFELTGHEYRALQIAQTSSQFVGLANACESFHFSTTTPLFSYSFPS